MENEINKIDGDPNIEIYESSINMQVLEPLQEINEIQKEELINQNIDQILDNRDIDHLNVPSIESVIETIKPEPELVHEPIIEPVNKEPIKEIVKPVVEPINQSQIIDLTMNANILKNVLNLQKLTSDEQLIKFYKNHIELNQCDPAHVMMIKQKIPVYNILEYKYVNTNTDNNVIPVINIGLDIDKIINGLKNIFKDLTTDNRKL